MSSPSSTSSDSEVTPNTGTAASTAPSSLPPSPKHTPVPEKAADRLAVPDVYPPIPQTTGPTSIDEKDLDTPDRWVRRDSRLVRLTGKHPFNVEAKLDVLFDAGFLTPAELFYVRNHGAVPHVDQEALLNWKIRVHGLVEHEIDMSLPFLLSTFEVVTLPITLVCAGNRRKEQNVVRKGLGFNWGAAGVSTALFTGVYLADVLDYVKPVRGKAKHVIFEGADQLPKGPYGTSQKLSWARDRTQGMLIAWAMNGLPLEPDHGFPVRVVIPGQIGGRSVKWLTSIEVSDQESQHHLHFWDNKVLPTEVTPDQARAEEHWWKDPRYLINDLNVNSAIAHPDHDEVLPITPEEVAYTSVSPAAGSERKYTVKGYAYAGGGRRVTRVEISLDQGETWKLADVTYPEDLYRTVMHNDPIYGRLDLTERDTCFCWCFWSYSVLVGQLAAAPAVMVRAMDAALALQQRDMYWNAMGMMNNWWFRVAIHREEKDGKTSLRFEHPTLAGVASGGWMERMKDAGENYLSPNFGARGPEIPLSSQMEKRVEVVMVKEGVTRQISKKELVEHNKASEPWFVVNGEVYDGTPFLDQHPGGAESIQLVAGEDASEDFMAIHSSDAKMQLMQFHIGTLVSDESENRPKTALPEEPIDDIFLHKTKWKPVELVEIGNASHDSRIYRFALQSPEQRLGLPVGQHVFVRLRRKDTGELVQRAYTPVSQQNATGFIDLLIKLYLPTDQFPIGGKMTSGFNLLEVGDHVEMKGPLGSFIWMGKSTCVWRSLERKVRNIGMICGGSGITPILQVLRAVLLDQEDKETRLWMLNANKTEQDILCKEELDRLLSEHGMERVRMHHTLGIVPPVWPYSRGRITDDMLRQHMPPVSDDGLILFCGPEPMVKYTVEPGLQRLGWDTTKQLVIF